jgi:hypothetical protein
MYMGMAIAMDIQVAYVTDPRKIAIRYLRTWFCVDAIGAIPWELIFRAIAWIEGSSQIEGSATELLALFKVSRV